MKIFLVLIIFICCVSIGLAIKQYYLRRQDFYRDLFSFCQNTKVYISYSQAKLSEIIEKNLLNCKKDFLYFLQLFHNYLAGNITKKDFISNSNLVFLDNEEREEVLNFFCQLGNMAKEEELEKIEVNMQNFERKSRKSQEENKKFSSLYVKLFLVLGLAIIIIFV